MLNLQAWLKTIEHNHSTAIHLGLDRIKAVAAQDALSHFHVPVITVTGTNGKGSCIAYLESILHSAGYRVGAYTSPHLYCFKERLRIDKKKCSDATWCEAFEQIDQTVKQTQVKLTFFEFITLAALHILQRKNLDIILLEVGLGGRLDAVNIVDPDVAIVTTVDLDHQAFLGNTREKIGFEKAGIFRKNKPAIVGDPHPPQSLIKEAENVSAPLHQLSQLPAIPYPPSCPSDLIQPSADCALMALQLLTPQLPITQAAIQKGLSEVTIKGRFQQFYQPCSIIFDVAHNPAAAAWLSAKLKTLPEVKKTYAVFSMLKDKDIVSTITPLKTMIDHWLIAPIKETDRAASTEELICAFNRLNINSVSVFPSICVAYQQAIEWATQEDLPSRVVVFGSFHTVGSLKYQHHSN